jgi:hypothetical protein
VRIRKAGRIFVSPGVLRCRPSENAGGIDLNSNLGPEKPAASLFYPCERLQIHGSSRCAHRQHLEVKARVLMLPAFRAQCLGKTPNAEAGQYFNLRYNKMSEPMQTTMREQILNKISAFIADPSFRHIAAQRQSTFSIAQAICLSLGVHSSFGSYKLDYTMNSSTRVLCTVPRCKPPYPALAMNLTRFVCDGCRARASCWRGRILPPVRLPEVTEE